MIYFVGDVHGQFRQLTAKMISTGIKDASLIQVGDFGAGLRRNEETELQEMNQYLGEKNNKLYIIRGNHDNPAYFSKSNWKGSICFLKDYSILEIEEKRILLAGGAVSIDRSDRVVGSSYWRNEGFNYHEGRLNKAFKDAQSIDIVVTHNAPAEFWPYDFGEDTLHFIERDENLRSDLLGERAKHSKLMEHLHRCSLLPRFWFYGHYHRKHKGNHNGISYRTLNSLEIHEHDMSLTS